LNAASDAIDIRLQRLTRRFATTSGPPYTAVGDISLDVRVSRFVSIVGPSGCGKSTVLKRPASEPSEGSIEVFGEPLKGINRRASYMFQQDALLPWKTELENIAAEPDGTGRTRCQQATGPRLHLARPNLA
jgi:sulfonate transport system ATP-binding protein